MALAKSPAAYTGVERDEAASRMVRGYLNGPGQRCLVGDAEETGLPDASSTVVYGEAMLTMQRPPQKRRIVGEAYRVLRPGGRYGIHELCLVSDDLDEGTKDEIQCELSGAIHVGAIFKLCQTGFGVAASTVSGAVAAGGAIFAVGSGLGVALLGVGYIVGLNIAVLVFMGGAISWFLGIPIYTALAGPGQIESITQGATGYDAALAVWSTQIRYLGVGAMATGGVWALVSLAEPVRDGVRSSMEAMRRARSGEGEGLARTEQDTPINFVLFGALAMAVPIFIVFFFVLDRDALGITGGLCLGTILFGVVFAFIAGFLFSSVAAYMAGLVGSSNNPISGVTIATILATSLILLVLLGTQIDFGVDAGKATAAAATAIMVGGVVCCAAAIGGDNMQDLKAGHIVGATPYKQQIMQIVGVVVAALAIAPILSVLYQAYGLGGVFPREGMDPSEALAAPQATLMASVSEGVFAGGLPWGIFAIGCVLAGAIIAADRVLESRGSEFRMPVLAVAVGLYLPIELSVPILAGGLVAFLASRSLSRRRAELGDDFDEINVRASRSGLLFASGLITGEALMGILLAIPFAIAQTTDIFAVTPGALGIGEGAFTTLVNLIGVAAFVLFAIWLYRVASGGRR